MTSIRRAAGALCAAGGLIAFGILGASRWGASSGSISMRVESVTLPRGASLPNAKPTVPLVFTSRTDSSSAEACSPETDEVYREPVRIPWAAREGRLRLLDPRGRLFELTWNRALPDGGTITDVMSPSVSLDGRRILFAGRVGERGRWRIFEIGVDGSGLRRLTGGPNDPGCVAVPPLRRREDGSLMSDAERRRVDFDDVDPADLGPNGFAFASSRIPDLGRDHSRRSTQIWAWPVGAEAPEPLSANRNNDRWPILLPGEQILFSLWSRNREAVAADLTDARPVSGGGEFATKPTDNWMGALVMTNGAQFGYAIKAIEPVWRPRPLFNGRIAFMTSAPGGGLRLAQADWGHIRTAPSSLANGADLPHEGGAERYFGPTSDAEGRPIAASCPSPMPNGLVVFSALPSGSAPEATGIQVVADDWTPTPPRPTLLFDDPALVDSEPVAVYARGFIVAPKKMAPALADTYARPSEFTMLDGSKYSGPMGLLENIAMSTAIRNPIPWHDRSGGKRVDPRRNPLISPPPNVAKVAVYEAGRDRFDDPERLRVPGSFVKRLVHRLPSPDDFRLWIPSNPLRPTVLVGLDAADRVAKWVGSPAPGRPARDYFAYAGDHYSSVRDGGYQYCNGCHAGHTYTVLDPTERLAESTSRTK